MPSGRSPWVAVAGVAAWSRLRSAATAYDVANAPKAFRPLRARDLPLESAAEIVTNRLGIVFEPHESLHRGDYFAGHGPGIAEAILRVNLDHEAGSLQESEFPDYQTILYLTAAPELSDQPPPVIQGLTLLDTKVV